MDRNTAYQRYCYLCWFGRRCLRIAAKGVFASAWNWSGVISSTAVVLLLQKYGVPVLPAETPVETIVQALTYFVLAWFLIFSVRLLVVAPFQVWHEGEWHTCRDGDRVYQKFVLTEPNMALHAYVSPDTNNQLFPFRYRDAPPGAFVEYKVEIEAPPHFLSLVLMAHPAQWADFKSEREHHFRKGGILCNRRNDLYLKTFVRPDALPFSVRVYVTGWRHSGMTPNWPPKCKAA